VFIKKYNPAHTTRGDRHIRPRPAGLPSVTPQDRRRRLQPDAECAGLVDMGAIGGDAEDDVNGW
jgi:hypothetical protein